MPNLIPVEFYQPLDSYNHLIDNQPLSTIMQNVTLVNFQTDQNANILRDAVGSAGTLSNRLNQSINPDGSLNTVAIDNALHSIAEHLDTNSFVRMTMGERAKLSLIASDATNFGIQFNTVSAILTFDDGILTLGNSDTISFRYAGGVMYADNAFPSSVRHIHYYGLVPVPVNLLSPDYTNYQTTSISTPYAQNSLRIYLNGVRLANAAYNEGTAVNGVVTSGLFSLVS